MGPLLGDAVNATDLSDLFGPGSSRRSPNRALDSPPHASMCSAVTMFSERRCLRAEIAPRGSGEEAPVSALLPAQPARRPGFESPPRDSIPPSQRSNTIKEPIYIHVLLCYYRPCLLALLPCLAPASRPHAPLPFRFEEHNCRAINTYVKINPNSSGMNTYANLRKFNPCRMNTCAKRGGGWGTGANRLYHSGRPQARAEITWYNG